jgi:FlaA1/EpsC-like NDP-sugar epimerase
MGEPIRIYDLAKRLIEDNSSDSKIIITGLRKGEKLSEELSYNSMTMDKTTNDKIFVVKKEIDARNLERVVRETLKRSLEYEIDNAGLIALLIKLGFCIKR